MRQITLFVCVTLKLFTCIYIICLAWLKFSCHSSGSLQVMPLYEAETIWDSAQRDLYQTCIGRLFSFLSSGQKTQYFLLFSCFDDLKSPHQLQAQEKIHQATFHQPPHVPLNRKANSVTQQHHNQHKYSHWQTSVI